MATRTTIVEKTTFAQNFQLLENGVAANLSSIPIASVVLLLNDARGNSIYTTGKLAYVDALNGKVSYSPSVTDLLAEASPYTARWKVTDNLGNIKYFPSGIRDTWTIERE